MTSIIIFFGSSDGEIHKNRLSDASLKHDYIIDDFIAPSEPTFRFASGAR